MKISRKGMEVIEGQIRAITDKLNAYVDLPKLDSRQREDFRDLQEQLRDEQRRWKVFSNSDSGK